MPKLPPNYVKAPAAKAKKSGARPTANAATGAAAQTTTLRSVQPLPNSALREVLVRLSDAQYSALEAACQELRLQGEEVSIGEMVQRVVAGWMTHTSNMRGSEATPAESGIIAQLMRFAELPVQRWRELGSTLRRLSSAALRTVHG